MNKLSVADQEHVIRCLTEGMSIRSVERITGFHRDTITRLMVRVGEACGRILDGLMRNLPCRRIEVDEIWCFVRKKQRHLGPTDDPEECGDFYTYTALDPVHKIIAAYRVGKRDGANARAFMDDLASRLSCRIQLSSDEFSAYAGAVESGFGGEVDYGQIVKAYAVEPAGRGRYSPPHVTGIHRNTIVGNPDYAHVCTSHVERSNLEVRQNMRRFTRLTLGFSKKASNLRAAVSLWAANYNLCRRHGSLRMPPALAAGVTNRVWDVADLVARTGW